MSNPDVSGMLRFLTDELQTAEDAGDSGEGPVIHTYLRFVRCRFTPAL